MIFLLLFLQRTTRAHFERRRMPLARFLTHLDKVALRQHDFVAVASLVQVDQEVSQTGAIVSLSHRLWPFWTKTSDRERATKNIKA